MNTPAPWELELANLRELIGGCDQKLIGLLAERNRHVDAVARLKADQELPIYNEDIELQKLVSIAILSINLGVNFEMARQIMKLVLADSNYRQEALIEKLKSCLPPTPTAQE